MTTAEPADRLPEPSRVEALAGFGLSAAEIARVFDLDQDLVKTTFARELSGGQIKANAWSSPGLMDAIRVVRGECHHAEKEEPLPA